MPVSTADEFFLQELRDVYSAEKQLVPALTAMAKATSSELLSSAFKTHLQETKGQIERLDRIFDMLKEKPGGETCEAMAGLVSEAEEMMKEIETPEVRDAALIAAAQKVEHYEIASYGTLRALAENMGLDQAAALLGEILQEEIGTDAKLTEIAENEVNLRMLRMEDGDGRA